MEIFLQPETYISLLTLTLLEIVLGIDNIIFISIITNKLPEEKQKAIRLAGLALAMVFRIILLSLITWIIQLKEPLFNVFNHTFSIRDLILIAGGVFLIAKSVSEIHHKIEGEQHFSGPKKNSSGFRVLLQIVVLDMVFSFDSILTAIGLSKQLLIMIAAVIISILIMMLFAGAISKFINTHPTLQILALSFLILIGFTLCIEAFHVEIPKGYIYFSVFFSFAVEIINIKVRKSSGRTKKV
jgi:predicted tellurium resistance membrane protein TerC